MQEENKNEKEVKKEKPKSFGRKLIEGFAKTTYDKALRVLRFSLLILSLVIVSFQLVSAITNMIQNFRIGNVAAGSLLTVSIILYAAVAFFYLFFYFQENKKDRTKVGFFAFYKKDILNTIRLTISLIAIGISIILLFTRTANSGGFAIFVLISSILNLIMNVLLFSYRLYKLVYSLHHKKQYEYEVVDKNLKAQKNRQLYNFMQKQMQEYREYANELDLQFKLKETQLKHDVALELGEMDDDMPILAHLVDDQYENNGIDHIRRTVRAVVLKNNKIALHKIYAKEDYFGPRNYYELPGGGVKDGESLEEALIRECAEELGLVVEIRTKIGRIDDFYNLIKQENHNYYFICEVVGKTEKQITEREKHLIQKTVWVSFDKAIALYNKSPDTGVSRLVKNRELPILQIAQGEVESS